MLLKYPCSNISQELWIHNSKTLQNNKTFAQTFVEKHSDTQIAQELSALYLTQFKNNQTFVEAVISNNPSSNIATQLWQEKHKNL